MIFREIDFSAERISFKNRQIEPFCLAFLIYFYQLKM